MNNLVIHVLSSAYNLTLPFIGISFGSLCVFIWSLPLVVKLIKSIF